MEKKKTEYNISAESGMLILTAIEALVALVALGSV